MQSQRLAKSVSQALVGNPKAFPEVRELRDPDAGRQRAEDWRRRGRCRAAPVQEALEPMLPLVERAGKNAGIVLAQQKTLTDVGQALRALNRQSSDLLEGCRGGGDARCSRTRRRPRSPRRRSS